MHTLLIIFGSVFVIGLAFLARYVVQTGVPRDGRRLWRNEDTGKLYVYQERAGFNSVRQDWWREVLVLPGDRLQYQGDWFKRNVGYPPRAQHDMTPFVQVPERELHQTLNRLALA